MSMLATWGREGRAMNILMFQELEFRPSCQNRFYAKTFILTLRATFFAPGTLRYSLEVAITSLRLKKGVLKGRLYESLLLQHDVNVRNG